METQNTNINSSLEQNEVDNQINLLEIAYKMLGKWYYFAVAVAVALIIAFIVNRYSVPKYEASTTILIKTNKDMMSNLETFGGMMSKTSTQDLQNALGTLKSNTTMKRAIKTMGLYCDYYQKKHLRNIDIYQDTPFEVVLDEAQPQPTEIMMKVDLDNANFCYISHKAMENVPVYDYIEDITLDKSVNIPQRKKEKITYGQWYSKDGMKFKIILKDGWKKEYAGNDYSFKINNMDIMAKLLSTVDITMMDKESSILDVKLRHSNPKKAVDFVNMICKIYIDQTFEEKNYLNVATINFVNTQLASIGDSLSTAEARKESFQQSSNTLNLTNDGQYLYTRTNELQTLKAEEYTRNEYYSYLADYLNKSDIDEGVASPSAMGVNDPVLNKLIEALSEAIVEHKTAVDKRTEKNPKTKELQIRIETLRKQISESLKNLKKVSDMNMRELQRQQNVLQAQIDKLPSTERSMINLERQFRFNDEIYTFLYQKRSEAEIAKNAALPDHKIIDKAWKANKVSPKSAMNYLVALLLGLLVPGAYIFIRYMTNDVVETKDDVIKITNTPIIGYIPRIPAEEDKKVVFGRPRSYFTEAYRAVRTNINFILKTSTPKAEGGKVVLATSAVPNESKSTTSFNVASVFALSGSKTLLVEYDLRKPRLANELDLDTVKGISSYFIGAVNINDAIQQSGFDNLDILASGPVPPNPSEIISSDKNKELIKELRKRYDYIIIDTPPISLISDAKVLAQDADVVLYLVRLGITSRRMLKEIIAEMEQSEVKPNIVITNIDSNVQRYGYGKGYRYGSGYYGNSYYGNYYGDKEEYQTSDRRRGGGFRGLEQTPEN